MRTLKGKIHDVSLCEAYDKLKDVMGTSYIECYIPQDVTNPQVQHKIINLNSVYLEVGYGIFKYAGVTNIISFRYDFTARVAVYSLMISD